MQNSLAYYMAVTWAFDSSRGPTFITSTGSSWGVLCASVAAFLEQDFREVKESMTNMARTRYGQDWEVVLKTCTGCMTLDDITPKRFGGKGKGLRDFGGVWEFLLRQKKKGLFT